MNSDTGKIYIQAINHVQEWIHSGDRATDLDLQTSQWGRNVFEWITEYTDELRAENKRLRNLPIAETQEKQNRKQQNRAKGREE